MKAAIYARVSTERQAERGTIGSQLAALRDQVNVGSSVTMRGQSIGIQSARSRGTYGCGGPADGRAPTRCG